MALLEFLRFDEGGEPLSQIGDIPQARYLRIYLADLRCSTVLIEPVYFDRDYLSEFQAFYSVSTRSYGNRCRRVHYFSEIDVSRDMLSRALCGDEATALEIRKHYLGFIVLRPIPTAPIGRTVLRWYPDQTPATPRVTTPSRDYHVHVAGLRLTVHGLAWQQQDQGVGACATIALWSMLHSSAFDDYHAIPSTSDITRFAHLTASLGARVFPSRGLTAFQVCEAIKECGLAPVMMSGDIASGGQAEGFRRERFASACTSLLRSGYPVLLLGQLRQAGGEAQGHAVCAVGFRESASPQVDAGQVGFQDLAVPVVYVHDDNLGPSVREQVAVDAATLAVELRPARPAYGQTPTAAPDPLTGYPAFRPQHLVVAMHEDLRTSPDSLNERALRTADRLSKGLQWLAKAGHVPGPVCGVALSTRFLRVSAYLGLELGRLLAPQPNLLPNVRLALAELAEPMSLHLGVARFGVGGVPVLDVLHDTTDSAADVRPFCYVSFAPGIDSVLGALIQAGALPAAPQIQAYAR